jgi:hypothetical protein
MGNWLSQTYPGEAPKLTEKNLPNQAGKVGGISIHHQKHHHRRRHHHPRPEREKKKRKMIDG